MGQISSKSVWTGFWYPNIRVSRECPYTDVDWLCACTNMLMYSSHHEKICSCCKNFLRPSLIVRMLRSACPLDQGDATLVGTNFIPRGSKYLKNSVEFHKPVSLSDRIIFGIPNGLMIVWSMAFNRLFDVLSFRGQTWMKPVKTSTASIALQCPAGVSGMLGMMSTDNVVLGAGMMGISSRT